jgi:hypothetical protein
MWTLERSSWRLRLGAGLLCVAAAVSDAWGQAPGGAPADLREALAPGTTAWITPIGGAEERTRIVDLSDDVIVTTTAAGAARRVRLSEIARVRVRRSDSLLDGALIGAGAGLASHLFGCRLTEPWDVCLHDTGPQLTFVAIGAGIGIGADALIRGRQTVFEAVAGSTRLRVLPVAAPGAAGFHLSLSF